MAHGNSHAGCHDLLKTVQKRVKPAYHIFGHIHQGKIFNFIELKKNCNNLIIDYGIWTDDTTTFINASICNRNYIPEREPIIFDIEPKLHEHIIE